MIGDPERDDAEEVVGDDVEDVGWRSEGETGTMA
jgi:hypothetical protein